MHHHCEGEARKFYWWSVVASECPHFEYDYHVCRTAADRYNSRLIEQLGLEHAKKGMVGIISLKDYIKVLEFRESELTRLLAAYDDGQESFIAANEWKWPREWGNIGWNSPIVSGHLRGAERALMETQNAIHRYRPLASSDA